MLDRKLDYVEHENDEMIQMINERLSMKENFAVALGNFFMDNIRSCVGE